MAKLALCGGTPVHTTGSPPWPQVTDADRAQLEKLLADGYRRGEYVSALERRFGAYCGVRHCIAVANGTVSLELILRALGIGYGDDVILSPYTFIATLSAIVHAGARPVFADIDRNTYNMDPADLEKRLTPNTKAVIVTAVAGRPTDSDAFEALAKKYGFVYIIDAAQAVGAGWKNVSLCKYGIAASISCQNSKNLTAGEGGFITTDNDALADGIRTILAGGAKDGVYVSVGQFHAMNDRQAALMLSQMGKLDGEIKLRERNAAYLDGLLRPLPFVSPTAHDPRITTHAYHLYMLRFHEDVLAEKGLDRRKMLKALLAEGIPFGTGYQPLYRFGSVGADLTQRIVGRAIDRRELPECAYGCDHEAAWTTQNVLLGTFEDMDDIADAMVKVWENADELRER